MFLYLDSSNFLTLGLFDKNFEWKEFLATKDLKSSSKIHGLLHGLLESQSLSLSDIKGVLHSAGPGSYTGMRVSEGFIQVLKSQGVPTYSFYHFEVPKYLGFDKGLWISKAFKKEVFIYEWENSENVKKLMGEGKFLEEKNDQDNQYFTHYPDLLEGQFCYTSELIYQNIGKVFKIAKERDEHLPPYYYRPLNLEFSKGKI